MIRKQKYLLFQIMLVFLCGCGCTSQGIQWKNEGKTYTQFEKDHHECMRLSNNIVGEDSEIAQKSEGLFYSTVSSNAYNVCMESKGYRIAN